MAVERDHLSWWWLSFVEHTTQLNLGVVVVVADDFLDAVTKAWKLGIDSDAEVAGVKLKPGQIAAVKDSANRLLTPASALLLSKKCKIQSATKTGRGPGDTSRIFTRPD
jgi:hypothetical protein